MAQIAKMDAQVSIKSSADRFFGAYCNQKIWPKMCPNIIKNVQPIKGDSVSSGSLTKFTYATIGDSSPETCIVENEVDEKNKSTTWTVKDGTVMKMYSLYKGTVQATNSPDGNGSLVKVTVEYEKLNVDVPEPAMYLAAAQVIVKSIDAYLLSNP